MTRFIVVQTSRVALFGAFTCSSAANIEAAAIGSLDNSVIEEGGALELETSVGKSDIGDALVVYEVPAHFPEYDETEICGDDTGNGGIFSDFKDFRLVGVLSAAEDAVAA
ncbi:hypothetical protein [Aureimonas glaciei]|uniref:Uncharacterized protein n=1 Tax=Aureimonas glaciei TaxID=1776957 RepID=A0A917DDS5_9HYPH|nr:hypothetical protein [Aureimonas glaciei]GGD28836.1 hypothetical protein GCM10011335_34980 [Aureimonas glaciei]